MNGMMTCITPDIEQWLIADYKEVYFEYFYFSYIFLMQVVSSWRGIASLLGLGEHNRLQGQRSCRDGGYSEESDKEHN